MPTMRIPMLAFAIALLGACGDDPPPPSPNQKLACDTLDFCRISASGLSCDADKASNCGQCINANSCDALRGGVCKPSCPGMDFKPK
jgi:hypothetical protein